MNKITYIYRKIKFYFFGIGKFKKITFPLVKQPFQKLLTEELVSVQPLTKKTDTTFTFIHTNEEHKFKPLTFGGFDFARGRFYINEKGNPVYSNDKDYERVRNKIIEKSKLQNN